MVRPYPYLLLPHLLSSRNRARRRERGDFSRGLLFGGVGIAVCVALFEGSFWLTGHLEDYAELGDPALECEAPVARGPTRPLAAGWGAARRPSGGRSGGGGRAAPPGGAAGPAGRGAHWGGGLLFGWGGRGYRAGVIFPPPSPV